MKKSFSLLVGIALLLTLSACGSKAPEKCDPITKEVEKVVDKVVEVPVIKEVEVKVEVPYVVDMTRQFEPGTYFKASEADENGVVTYATVVVDAYGQVAGINFGNTTTKSSFKFDEETKELFYYVPGVKDVIPNTYRKVDLSKPLPTIEDGITTEDIIEGYPLHDERIATLVDIKANETQAIVDQKLAPEVNTWTEQMDAVAKKIVADQGTYGINLYQAGDKLLTNSVDGVSIEVEKELRLLQSILDNDAKLGSDTVLAKKADANYGIYKPGTYYAQSAPIINDKNEVIYNTAVVVVDEFGRIAGVKLDETYAKDGVSTTKQILGDAYGMANSNSAEWYAQVALIEDAIVRNQSVEGFTYVDATTGLAAKLPAMKADNSGYEAHVKLSNVAGATIKAEGLINTVKGLLESNQAKLDLQPGTYQNTDKDGNIMTIVVKPVVTSVPKGSTYKVGQIYDGVALTGVNKGVKVENQVISMILDTVQTAAQAKFTDEKGQVYDLYKYEMGGKDSALEIEKTVRYIYKDGETYRYAEDFVVNGKDYEVGDSVRFDFDGYDEKATIVAVAANATKASLKDLYVLGSGTPWVNEQALYTNEFVGTTNPHQLNMVGQTTDSVAGLTIKVDGYNKLAVDTYRMATDADKKVATVSDDTLNLLNRSLKAAGLKLANGTYTTMSELPNAEGGFYIINVAIYNNEVVALFLDETVSVDGKWTTKASLGEDYRVSQKDGKLVKSTDKKDATYQEAIVKVAEDLVQDGVNNLAKLTEKYDYELTTTFDRRSSFLAKESKAYSWNNAFEKLLLEGLQARVPEALNALISDVEKQLADKANYVVASDPRDAGKLELVISSDLFKFAENSDAKEIRLDIEAADRNLDADFTRDGKLVFAADADDFAAATVAKVTVTLEFDDYAPVQRELGVRVQSMNAEKQALLNKIDSKLGQDFTTLMGGATQEIVLAAKGAQGPVKTNRLGSDKANANIQFKLQSQENLVITSVIKGEANGVSTGDSLNVKLENGQVSFEAVDTAGLQDAVTVKVNDKLTVELKGQDTKLPDSLTKEEVAAFNAYVVEKMFANGSKIKVDTIMDTKKPTEHVPAGTLVIRAWFDNYEQDARDGKGSYQKGEAYKDFTFTVLSEKEAVKQAKAATTVGKVLDTVTVNGAIDLTDLKDVKIDGLTTQWEVKADVNAVNHYYKSVEGAEGFFNAKVTFIDGYEYINNIQGSDQMKVPTGYVYVQAESMQDNTIADVNQTVKKAGDTLENNAYHVFKELTYTRDVLLTDAAGTVKFKFDKDVDTATNLNYAKLLTATENVEAIAKRDKVYNIGGNHDLVSKVVIDGYTFTPDKTTITIDLVKKDTGAIESQETQTLSNLLQRKMQTSGSELVYVTHTSANTLEDNTELVVNLKQKDTQKVTLRTGFNGVDLSRPIDAQDEFKVLENEFVVKAMTVEAIEAKMKDAVTVEKFKTYLSIADVNDLDAPGEPAFAEKIKTAVTAAATEVTANVTDVEVVVKDANGKDIKAATLEAAVKAQLGKEIKKGEMKDVKFTVEVKYTAKDETERSFTKELTTSVYANANTPIA